MDVETRQAVFQWVLQVLAEKKLLKGTTIGVDATALEANAALRSIVRRDTGEKYEEFLARLAKESGIQTPTKRAVWQSWIGGVRRKDRMTTGGIRTILTRVTVDRDPTDLLQLGDVVLVSAKAGIHSKTTIGCSTFITHMGEWVWTTMTLGTGARLVFEALRP